MKEAINNNGELVQVSVDTPVKTKDGIHYLLTPADEAEIAEREAAGSAGAAARSALDKINKAEAQITVRRLREAILGKDNGWLVRQNELIIAERAKL